MTRGTSKKGPQSKKKRLTHCGPGPRCSLTSFPGRLFRPGPAGDFFLLRPRADAHSLFFVFCCGPARTGVVFFLLWPRPDAHSLTVGWVDFGKARVVFFFAAAPPNPASQ